MKNDFYTFGGKYFWEDVFFYQKWRIQRNPNTKKYRLLDNYDIRRCEGSYEECYKSFADYCRAFELPRQHGHMIIMINSLGQSKAVFKPLWRAALSKGFLAAAVNYSPTQNDLKKIVRLFDLFLNLLEDVDKVSFVTLGTGNIVLQELLKKQSRWQKRLNIGKVVCIDPYLRVSELMKKIADNKLLSFFTGPLVADLTDRDVVRYSACRNIDTAFILTDKPCFEKISEWFTNSAMPDLSLSKIKKMCNITFAIKRKGNRYNILKNKHVCENILHFLKFGIFYNQQI